MPQSPPFLAAGALTLAVSACASAAMPNDLPADAPHGASQYERPNETQPGAKPPVPRRNPAAIAYELTLTVAHAPGPLAFVSAGMSYDVVDPRCLPRLGGMSGTRVTAEQSVPVKLERIGPDTYRGVVYDDLFVDEDYYGLGLCRWRLTGVGFVLRATGADGETRFLESVSHDDIVAGKTQRSYFEKRFYPSMDIPNFPAGGVRDLSRFKPGYGGPEHLFTVDAALRRVSP